MKNYQFWGLIICISTFSGISKHLSAQCKSYQTDMLNHQNTGYYSSLIHTEQLKDGNTYKFFAHKDSLSWGDSTIAKLPNGEYTISAIKLDQKGAVVKTWQLNYALRADVYGQLIKDDTLYVFINSYSASKHPILTIPDQKNGIYCLKFSLDLEPISIQAIAIKDASDSESAIFGAVAYQFNANELIFSLAYRGNIFIGTNKQLLTNNKDDFAVITCSFNADLSFQSHTKIIYDDFPFINRVVHFNGKTFLSLTVNKDFKIEDKTIESIDNVFPRENDIVLVEYTGNEISNYYQIGSGGSDGVQGLTVTNNYLYVSINYGSTILKVNGQEVFTSNSFYNSTLLKLDKNGEIQIVRNFENQFELEGNEVEPNTTLTSLSGDSVALVINYVDQLITGQDVIKSISKLETTDRYNSVLFIFKDEQLQKKYLLGSNESVQCNTPAYEDGALYLDIKWKKHLVSEDFDETNANFETYSLAKICLDNFKPMSTNDNYSNTINLYPNPVHESLYLGVDGDIEFIAYSIYDITGRMIKQSNNSLIDKQIPTMYLNKGVYFLLIQQMDGTTISAKFFK